MKKIKLVTGLLLITVFINVFSFSQDFGIDKYSWMISGSLSFSKTDGELFEDIDGNKTTTLYLAHTNNFFILKGLFIGLGINYTYQRTGSEGRESYGLGPNLGYAFGKKENKLYPYLIGGYRFNSLMYDSERYYNDLDLKGRSYFGGLGLIIPLKDHIGITIELDYSKYKFDIELNKFNGSIITFSAGIVGLIF